MIHGKLESVIVLWEGRGWKQRIVSNEIQITNDRPVYNLPLVKYNVYCPIISHFYCMT